MRKGQGLRRLAVLSWGKLLDAQVVAFGWPPTPTHPTVGEGEHGGLALFQVAGAVR